MLEEEIGSLAGLDREVLLDFRAFLAAEGRVGEHHGEVAPRVGCQGVVS